MRRKLTTIVATFAAVLLCTAACNDKNGTFKTPEWELPSGGNGSGSGNGNGEGGNGSSDKPDPKPEEKAKPRYIWVDAAANFPDFANSKENIARDLKLAKETGFTDVVVDVRPTNGNVLFRTTTGTACEWLGAWVGGRYTKTTRTADWDYLDAFIEEGHKLGLRIHAGFNTMVGGNKTSLGAQGILYSDSSKKEWALYYNREAGIVNACDSGESTLFLNPASDEAMAYLIAILKDLAAYKELDGIILDRCRYAGLQTDFSEITRKKFMEYAGISTISWPDDVLPAGATYSTQPSSPRKYFKLWLEFRAKTIHDFVESARDAVKAVNPDVMFGVYVGGWYSQYYDVGVNWASPSYNASLDFPKWATTEYMKYGYADHCDHMLIGAYANPGAVYGTGEWTMQGFCSKAKDKIGGACPRVCGGPDVGNWDSSDKYTQAEEEAAITNSVKACYDACDGYFLFDMIHLKQANQWRFVKKGIDEALKN